MKKLDANAGEVPWPGTKDVNGNIIDPGIGEKIDAESYFLGNPVVVLSHIEVKK